jgi:hypothetical protein
MSYKWSIEVPTRVFNAYRTVAAVYFRLADRPGCLFFIGDDEIVARCDGGDSGDEDQPCSSSD